MIPRMTCRRSPSCHATPPPCGLVRHISRKVSTVTLRGIGLDFTASTTHIVPCPSVRAGLIPDRRVKPSTGHGGLSNTGVRSGPGDTRSGPAQCSVRARPRYRRAQVSQSPGPGPVFGQGRPSVRDTRSAACRFNRSHSATVRSNACRSAACRALRSRFSRPSRARNSCQLLVTVLPPIGLLSVGPGDRARGPGSENGIRKIELREPYSVWALCSVGGRPRDTCLFSLSVKYRK
jgi:hypothetical protein